MQARTISRVVAAVAVIVVGGLVLLARRPSQEPIPVPQPGHGTIQTPAAEPLQIAAADPPAPSHEELVAAKVAELEAMSETFRNTTFLIAIRDAGLVCNELLRVFGGIDESAKWIATCSEMLAYTVSVASTGTLHVEPLQQYWDAVPWPVRIEGDTAPLAPRPEIRDQRLLPQQQQQPLPQR